MSTSSFSINDMFSMLNIDSPNYSAPLRGLSPDRHQRPVSEILKRDSFKSPETQVLDKWFEDLQQYESSLEAMATASLDPKYKEEVQHVDQWFRYLNEAERTATIYTLLEHSTQVQIRFFMAVLQQMSQKDPLAVLLPTSHPEKDAQSQMAKAELEASQKLASVIPYQTGRPMGRHLDRQQQQQQHHSDFLSPRYPSMPLFDPNSRPKSVIETDLSSIFKNDWSFGLAPPPVTRPKSADISNWSFNKESPWTPKLEQQWSNRSSLILAEEVPSPPVVLSVYDNKTLYPEYSTFQQTPTPSQYGQFLNPPPTDENGYFSDHSDQSNKSHKNKFRSKEKKHVDVVDMQLLEDVPAWLRSLRLHKYNPIFESMKWQQMLKMDDAALLAKGVTALGARRKLLKVFELIKAHCQANNITY